MKIQVTLLLLCFIIITESSLKRYRLPASPAHPGRCFLKGWPNLDLEVGEKKQMRGTCQIASCAKSGDGFLLSYLGCAKVTPASDKCKVLQDFSKPHPHCCQRLVCQL